MDAIAIDTNVFVHMFNDRENHEQHIDKLLRSLMSDSVDLCLDKSKFIATEYEEKLSRRIRESDDTGIRLQILRYWMDNDTKREVAIERTGDLMRNIKGVIHENRESVDRMFVAVAFVADVVFVTNDDIHILIGPPGERNKNTHPRRARLLKVAKRLRLGKNSDILASRTAAARL